MVSRRRLLRLGAACLTGLGAAGCLGGPRGGDDTRSPARTTDSTVSTPETLDDGPTTTPGDLPAWEPDWSLSFDGRSVLGLDADPDGDGTLFVTLSRNGDDSAVAAVDPADEAVLWRTGMDGEAVAGTHASFQRISRGGWGATLTRDAVYSVAGRADEREWTALHAFDRSTGEKRWSLRRDRRLSVAGVSEGLLVAAGLEFFPPPDETPTSHQTPEEPLTTVVYGVDPAEGDVTWTREFAAVEDVAVGEWGVFVATADGLVVLARDGETRFSVGDGPATWVEAAGDRLFALSGDGDDGDDATIRGVAPNGDVDWRVTAPVHELLLAGDRLYAGGDAVLAVESDGTVAWRDDAHGQWLLRDPDGDTLYTRSGVGMDAATAYAASGGERWTFDPPSNDAWPEAATDDRLVATAITADDADEPFYTVYAVNGEGKATAALGKDTVFDALGVGDTAYLADGESNLLALTP